MPEVSMSSFPWRSLGATEGCWLSHNSTKKGLAKLCVITDVLWRQTMYDMNICKALCQLSVIDWKYRWNEWPCNEFERWIGRDEYLSSTSSESEDTIKWTMQCQLRNKGLVFHCAFYWEPQKPSCAIKVHWTVTTVTGTVTHTPPGAKSIATLLYWRCI